MHEFIHNDEKIIKVGEPIIFENKTDSAFDVDVGIIFHKSGLYDVSIGGKIVSVKKVSSAPSVSNQWIPCSERLPEEEENKYWICTDTEYQCQCRWTNDNLFWHGKTTDWHWNIFDIPQYSKVVAWMSLPEPWKGEGDDKG